MAPTITQLSKPEKVIYRTTTGIVCAVMIFSIINFIFNDHFPFPNGPEGAFVHLGLPRYFKIELTIAKILGVLALLIPRVPAKIKEFAYFGFGITLFSASVAHFARGDARLSAFFPIDPLLFLGTLIVSYFYFEKSHSFPGPPNHERKKPQQRVHRSRIRFADNTERYKSNRGLRPMQLFLL